MTSSSNPLKALFRSQPSSQDANTAPAHDSNAGSKRKNKPAATAFMPDTIEPIPCKRSGLLSSFLPLDRPSPSTSDSSIPRSSASSYSSMLMLPPALFPSYPRPLPPTPQRPELESGSGNKNPKQKHGLFSKAKKHPKNPITTPEKPPDQESPGWRLGGWTSRGESPPREQDVQSINAEASTGFRGRIRMAKMNKVDMDATAVQHHEDLSLVSQTKATKMLAIESSQHYGGGIEKSSNGQIMLHPSYNLSKRSGVSSRSLSPVPPTKDQSLTTGMYQQQHCYSCQQQVYHQHCQVQQRPPRAGVTLAVHDVFGIGKVAEMAVALFLAHDSFLSRRPPVVQYMIMTWEATVVLMIIWGVLRIIGLAEVVVWRADDLVGGILSMIWAIGRVLRAVVGR